MKKLVILIIILILIIGTGYFLKNNELKNMINKITGQISSDIGFNEYTYTKAICNETNFCQDYVIHCNKSDLKSIKPITGAIVQHDNNWTDPRGIQNYTKREFCG